MKERIEKKYYPVDLHVHTPASNCYIRSKEVYNNEDEYINLLKLYQSKKIKVIAITDHNTVKGYKELMRIKKDYINEISQFSKLSYIDGVAKEIEKREQIIKLFEEILILPGVEIEVFPSIHILIIFNPNISIESIENFLIESGYPENLQGKDDYASNIGINEILDIAKKMGAITIGAHIDSSKGIYNELKGMPRANVLCSESLMGVQVNNLATISIIESLLNNKQYTRKSSLGFIRASDFHNEPEKKLLEDFVTYMKLDLINFESLYNVFNNPPENISFSQNPKDMEIITNLIKAPNTVFFDNINTDNLEEIGHSIVALLNQGKGMVIFGINKFKAIVGIKNEKKETEDLIIKAIDLLDDFKNYIFYSIRDYKFGKNRVFVLELNSLINKIYSTRNYVYLLEGNNKVKIASFNDLINIGKNQANELFNEFQKINNNRLNSLYEELEIIKNLENNKSLYNKIIINSVRLEEVIKVEFITNNVNNDLNEIFDKLYEGDSTGKLFYIHEEAYPQDKEFYIRCSCRRTNSDFDIEFDSETYNDDCIIIVPGGRSYLINNQKDYKIINSIPFLRLTIKNKYKNLLTLEAIIAWLKSPIFLWYIEFKYIDFDFFPPNILLELPIPMINNMNADGQLVPLLKKIIEFEFMFLDKFKLTEDTNEDFEYIIDEHNNEISKLAIEIDKLFHLGFNINAGEIVTIKQFLNRNKYKFIDYEKFQLDITR